MQWIGFSKFFGFVVFIALIAPTAWAQTPEDTVRWIYTSLAQPGSADTKGLSYLASPEQRAQFLSRRMVAFYQANDSYGDDPAGACVDFGLEIPGNDFDISEILRTLSLTMTGDSARTSVIASFSTFGTPAQVVYDFIVEDGYWRIDDIAGPGWRVSQISCSPRPGGAVSGYCFSNGSDALRLDVAADGSAVFDLESWQANGHSCGAGGYARAMNGGWTYEDVLYGTPCRIDILVTPDQGLRLSDVGGACRRTLCGARAVIDGLIFPRSSQIDCSLMPAN